MIEESRLTYVRTYLRNSFSQPRTHTAHACRVCSVRTYVQPSACSFMMVIHHHGHQHQAISQGAPRRSRTYACARLI